MVTHTDSNFLQVFINERFTSLTSKPIEFPTGHKRGDAGGWLENMKASHTYEPSARRWLNVKPPAGKSLVKVLDKEILTSVLTLTHLGVHLLT